MTGDHTTVARATDPLTSHEAAWSIQDLSDLQAKVLDLLADLQVATDEQLVNAYVERFGQVSPSTVRTRRRELEDMGAVRVVDAAGLTRGGRRCQRFAATPNAS